MHIGVQPTGLGLPWFHDVTLTPKAAQPLPCSFEVDWRPGSPKELFQCTKLLQGSGISGNAAKLTQTVVSMSLPSHRSALFILFGDLEEMLLAETPFIWTCFGP